MKKVLFCLKQNRVGGVENISILLANRLKKKYFDIIDPSISTSQRNKDTVKGSGPYKIEVSHYQMPKKMESKALLIARITYFLAQPLRIFRKIKAILGLNIQKINYKILKMTYGINLKIYINHLIEIVKLNKIDTIVLSDEYHMYYVEYIKKCCPEVKVILWIHSSISAYLQYPAPFTDYIESINNSVDKLICLNQNAVDFFKNKVIKIPNMASNDMQYKQSSLEAKRIIWVGRIDDNKNIDLALNFMTKLDSEITLSIVCSATNRELDRLKEKILNKGISKRVAIHTNQSRDQIAAHYQNASLYISTSIHEAFSITALEAMSSGLPVIATNTEGLSEITANGKYGVLVDDFNEDEFANKISELFKDKTKLIELSNLSKTRISDFSEDKILEQWKILLSE